MLQSVVVPDETTPTPILDGVKTDRRRRRRRRQHENSISEEAKTPNPTSSGITIDGGGSSFEIFDGLLDPNSYYTGFVEVVGEFYM